MFTCTYSTCVVPHLNQGYLFRSQEIEIHMDEELDDPDSESDVQLLWSSTPHGLAGKRGGRSKGYYSRDDELLDEAVGKSYLLELSNIL